MAGTAVVLQLILIFSFVVLGIAGGEPEHFSYVYLRIVYGVLSVGYSSELTCAHSQGK